MIGNGGMAWCHAPNFLGVIDMTYQIYWNSRDGGYNVDRLGHGYLTTFPTLTEAVAWIIASYGYEDSNNKVTIEYMGDLFA